MADFQVSVIIPAYNASRFIRKAVEAAHSQEEVGEIVIVEDCSPDDTYEVCLQIEKEYNKVKLYRHPDEQNHGCGASRNLGLEYSRFPYVTFADADNYLLPGRFQLDKILFEQDEDVDGVYHAEGIHYYSDSSKEIFQKTVNMEILTFSGEVPPEEVCSVLMGTHPEVHGAWGVDSLTIKKSLFAKTGVFNTRLELQQDLDLFIKMATLGKFVPGNINEPQSIRGVHNAMRSTDVKKMRKNIKKRWSSLNTWFNTNEYVSDIQKSSFNDNFRYFRIKSSSTFLGSILLTSYVIRNIKMIARPYELYDISFFTLYGRNWLTLHLISIKNKFFNKLR